jgi:predicted acetyltransferase
VIYTGLINIVKNVKYRTLRLIWNVLWIRDTRNAYRILFWKHIWKTSTLKTEKKMELTMKNKIGCEDRR